MTTKEFIARQNRIVDSLTKDNKPLLLAVKSVMAAQARRIFFQGKNADGSIIGEYVDNSIYINPSKVPPGVRKFQAKGKNGDTKFENGNKHKTGYFENWLAFKKKVGKNQRIKTVDLIYSGELSKDWANAETINAANATRLSPSHFIVGIEKHNAVKVERYGNVFGLTTQEKKLFFKVIQGELGKLFGNDKRGN